MSISHFSLFLSSLVPLTHRLVSPVCHKQCLIIPAVIWQTQQCQLTLHYENGFTLTTQHPPDQSSPVLWHFPFEKMQGSADDGTRLLWLNFGDDGEQVKLLTIYVSM